ncbi:MAG: T9SS type B sorting domain-containing protein [Bacteroidetes bacterium]|nr:MAG: T9SS type B sorting domain-containing protein [Bacteroidota bacterium]
MNRGKEFLNKVSSTEHSKRENHNCSIVRLFVLRLLGCLSLTVSCLLSTTASATHLMGGWAGYQYLGLNSVTGNYEYQVTFKVYLYCDDITLPCGTCTNAPLDPSIQVGAYTQDFLDPNNPNKILAASFTIPLGSQTWVPLPGAAQCATAPVVCVEEGIYTMQVELPPSNGGYHLIFERCCRNYNIINLPSPPVYEGQTYYAFIPPTFINNNSPTFAQPPVPYICVNDTASILNTAIDPDGDVIVYSLVHPFTGYADQFNPAPAASNPYVFPIPLVPYNMGFSAAQPFGAGGYASVNAFTGLSQYLSPGIGNYVVAVELQEYRNNQLIGVTRLDMQIIVINCPPNNAPVLSSTTSQTSYVAQAGDSLCFPIKFADVNPGDSVFLTGSGAIFNLPTNPAATLTPNPNAGLGSATSQFCWDMGCNQPGNYIFIVQSPDNGCPPKIAYVVYTIQVLPYVGPTVITGPSPLCTGSSGTYSVPAASGTTFTWVVTGGAITSGQSTNSININWGASSSGTVSVTSYNVNGCPSDPISLNVNIQSPPVINAGTNSTICAGSSVTLTSTGGGSYFWVPSAGLSNPNISNPVASPTSATNYIVTVTSAIGCSNTDTVSINLHAPFMANAGNNNTVCTGGSLTLGGSPTGPAGSTYLWSPATGLSSTSSANPIVSPTSAVTYTLVVTNATACKDTDVVTIAISSPPVANAGSDITVCPGSNTTLNGTGGGTYNWSPSSSLNNPNISNPVASPTSNTTYTLVVSLSNCTDTDFVSMTTLPFPAVSAGADVSFCIGGSATLSAAGTGTYLWSPSSALSCITCASPVANPSTTTNYTVTITDASSCTNSDAVQVMVNPLPLANAGPKPGWVCPGFSLSLSASNGVAYNWAPSASLSNPNISNPVATPTSATTYTVNITDSNGCSNRDTVTISPSPTIPTNAGNNPSICFGQSATLGGNPTAPLNVTGYQWTPSTSLNSSTIANPVTTPIATTTYILTTTSNTCNGKDTIVVSVNALPVVSAGADVSICVGNSSTLISSGGQSYLWSNGGTTTSISVAPTSSSTYTVTGTDANGCTNSDSANVFVNTLPIVSAGGNLSVCSGTAATLIGSGAPSYLWSTGATTTTVSVSPTIGTTYTVTGTDANGCTNVDSATVFVSPLPAVSAGVDVSICIGTGSTLTGSGAQTYLWNTGVTTSSIPVVPTSSSTYTVVGTDVNGCTNLDTATVFVSPLPAVSAGTDVSVCFGSATTLTGSGGQTFIWSPAGTLNNANISNPVAVPTSATTYTMVATDANSCSNLDTVNVIVLALPSILTSNDTAICTGNAASLNASGGLGYNWSPSTALNNSTIANPIASPTISTTYTVTVTNADGCTKTDSVKVSINPSPLIDAGTNTVVCPGSAVTLNATGGITYVWSPSTGLSNSTISNPDASPSVITTYTVVGTNANGCTDSDFITISIGLIPTANFGYTLSLACGGMQAQFTDSSLNATGWSWNFGDGSTSLTTSSPIHTFPYSANYVITLTVTNPPCLDAAQTTISVDNLSSYLNIDTYNVFTPNNDGMNDCFRLNTNGRFAGCADLTIYNRWGVQVFHTEYSGACWDGRTAAGISVPDGTYFYLFDLNGLQLKGFITVLR